MESGETGWAAVGWAWGLPELAQQAGTELEGTAVPMQGQHCTVLVSQVSTGSEHTMGRAPGVAFSTHLGNGVPSHGEEGNTAPKNR